MIEYNWKEIKKHTKGDISKILEYFTYVYVLKGTMYEYLLEHSWANAIYNSPEPKKSYLLNIDALIANELNATTDEQYVYLDLASKRDIFTYNNTKGNVIFLPHWTVEKYYTLNELKTNRLLTIDSKTIYLIYEGED